MNKIFSLGIDVGSTTVKTVILDEAGNIIRSRYQRHFSKVRETVEEQLSEIAEEYSGCRFRLSITGSAGLEIGRASCRERV